MRSWAITNVDGGTLVAHGSPIPMGEAVDVVPADSRADLTCEECEAILPAVDDMAGVVSGFAPQVRARYPDFAAIAARLREAILRG